MKISFVAIATGLSFLAGGCQTGSPSSGQREGGGRVSSGWWRQWHDPALDRDIAAAFSSSPDLRAVALKVERAGAVVENAQGALLPRLNLGFGYTEGRRRNIDFGPFDLPPWQSSAALSWELDLSGKLRAARNSATENRTAAVEDLRLARLVLASRLAGLRLNLYRLNSEIEIVGESLEAVLRTGQFLEERQRAGLIPETVVEEQTGEIERLKREKLDLTRQRDLTVVRLRTLRGGSDPADPDRSRFPEPKMNSSRPLNEVLSSHPVLQAAAARVRAAFQLERSARLDLLPSFRIEALATGGQKKLADRFRVWTGQVGPSLDLPVYDPARLARVKLRKAEAGIAAANYRQAVLEVLADVDTARINLASRQSQLAAAVREAEALGRSRDHARERLESGIISQIDFLKIEGRWLEARRGVEVLRQGVLSARVDLIKATGGGAI